MSHSELTVRQFEMRAFILKNAPEQKGLFSRSMYVCIYVLSLTTHSLYGSRNNSKCIQTNKESRRLMKFTLRGHKLLNFRSKLS